MTSYIISFVRLVPTYSLQKFIFNLAVAIKQYMHRLIICYKSKVCFILFKESLVWLSDCIESDVVVTNTSS